MPYFAKIFASALILAAAQATAAAVEDTSVQRAIDRGRTMYLYDRAAWITSDDAMMRVPTDRAPEIGGWIVTAWAPGLHVDYFGKDAAAEHVIYSADIADQAVTNATVYPVSAEPALKGQALAMARALRAAWAEVRRHPDWRSCAQARFNTVVLPPQSDGTIPVYFLTPQTRERELPVRRSL